MLDIKCFNSKEPYGSNCYLISSNGEYALIDPSVSFEDVLKQININGRLKYIIITHAHFDHILKIDTWTDSGAKVLIGREDRAALADPYKNCYSVFFGVNKGYFGKAEELSDGQILFLGNDEIKVISTPGHTPGGIALQNDNILFSGDTIFAEGYGRYDLPGGDPKVLFNTIRSILRMPEDTVVYSGHGPTSTIGKIKRYLNFI